MMGHAHEKRHFWQESNLVMLTAVCIYLTFGKIIWHQCRWGEQWREKKGQEELEEKKLGYEQRWAAEAWWGRREYECHYWVFNF